MAEGARLHEAQVLLGDDHVHVLLAQRRLAAQRHLGWVRVGVRLTLTITLALTRLGLALGLGLR